MVVAHPEQRRTLEVTVSSTTRPAAAGRPAGSLDAADAADAAERADVVLDLRSPLETHDNAVLLAVLRTRDRAATTTAIRAGTVVLAQATTPCGQRTVALCTDVEGRRTACAFSAMALFMDWARRAGHRGGHLVVAGADLERVLAAEGVVTLALDPGAPHTHSLDVAALAGSLV